MVAGGGMARSEERTAGGQRKPARPNPRSEPPDATNPAPNKPPCQNGRRTTQTGPEQPTSESPDATKPVPTNPPSEPPAGDETSPEQKEPVPVLPRPRYKANHNAEAVLSNPQPPPRRDHGGLTTRIRCCNTHEAGAGAGRPTLPGAAAPSRAVISGPSSLDKVFDRSAPAPSL